MPAALEEAIIAKLLAELEATAKWCDERAAIFGCMTAPAALRTVLNAEASRWRGRAALIRQVILEAKGTGP